MNQQCKVCGEPAAGFHFGAFTCEGCKSFFGRTYNNLGSITECKNNGECVINKKNRTACKACRLRKCLLVGMSKSGSRYGRRSNWFKIHCLLEEQSQNGHKVPASLFGPPGFYPRSLYSNPLLSPDKLMALHGYPRKEEVRSESGESSPGDYDDETRSTLSFLHPNSSHTTPSPKHISPFSSTIHHPSSPVGTIPPYSPPVTSGGIFFPPHSSPTRLIYPPSSKPCGMPTSPLLPSWPPARVPFGTELLLSGSTPRTPMGGDLLLCSPTVGGVAVEQDAPIDLSVKTSIAYQPPTPRSEISDRSRDCDSDDELSIDVGGCNDGVSLKNNPLDLTAKRVEVPQSG